MLEDTPPSGPDTEPTIPDSPSSVHLPHSDSPYLTPIHASMPSDTYLLNHGLDGHYLDSIEIDDIMTKAYGRPLVRPGEISESCPWYTRWKIITQHRACHYSLPGGPVGRKYVDALRDEVLHLASGNYPSERLIIFSSLMLQRDRSVKKGNDIRRLLERRLSLWSDAKFEILIQEAIRCNRTLKLNNKSYDGAHVDKIFSKLMFQGKIKAAVRWVTERSQCGLLTPSDEVELKADNGSGVKCTVMDVLRTKHPDPHPPHSLSLLTVDELPDFEDIEITGALIHNVTFGIQGGAGPGGCDASHWHDVLLRYGSHSSSLRDAVATLSRTLANNIIQWSSIKGLLANRLIALDKNPGVRPIGIGETLRRIIGKALCCVTRDDAEAICGTDQLCAGVKMGTEAAFHAFHDLFESQSSLEPDWGLLTIDASNAFNSINRVALLWNTRLLWPRAARFVFNTYQGWSTLVLRGSNEHLLSKEGVTQGDPISMFLYAIGSLPLIQLLKDVTRYFQIWFADDSGAGGKLSPLKEWFDKIRALGPLFGYFPETSNSHLIVNECGLENARLMFADTGVNVVTSGKFLGGLIGIKSARDEFILNKVKKWTNYVRKFSSLCVDQPQSAYIALSKSLQSEWIYLQRIMSDCDGLFSDVECAISDSFIPSLFGCGITSHERSFLSLPVRFGGLNVKDPTITAPLSYMASRNATDYLVNILKENVPFESETHCLYVYTSKLNTLKQHNDLSIQLFNAILSDVSEVNRRTLQRAKDSLSSWLSVPPIKKDNFDLTAVEFHDGLALRYGKPLLQLPPTCDGCGSEFNVTHALDCRKGGLVVLRHNEIRDTISSLASMIWGQVTKEPVISDSSTPNSDSLIADIAIRGVWQRQTTALFDVRVIDTDAKSYLHQSPQSVLATAEKEKKRKY
jgi:hypothetical protein